MTEKLYECAGCFIIVPEAETIEAEVEFALDKAGSGLKRVCKQRDDCNDRRHQRLVSASGASTIVNAK